MASTAKIVALAPLQPDLGERAWVSVPHPTLPLLATAHAKAVTVFSLATLSSHSTLTGGHTRSVRSVAWEPGLPPRRLCLVTGSFDSTAGLWRWDGGGGDGDDGDGNNSDDDDGLEVAAAVPPPARSRSRSRSRSDGGPDGGSDKPGPDWDFTLVLEGHDSEIKSCAFSPSGTYLATCSRDKSVWIWEDVGSPDAADEWETVAILNEHDGDVKAVAWCPDVPARNARRCYGPDVLASASYDNTVRIWREDADADWVCAAVLEGHAATVWGLQWEPRPPPGCFPRLLTCSADATVRVWTLGDGDGDDDGDDDGSYGPRAPPGAIPSTMRASLREHWACTAVLPRVHDGDIYAAAWSGHTGLVATTGSDGVIALYRERDRPADADDADDADDAAASRPAAAAAAAAASDHRPVTNGAEPSAPSSAPWELLATLPNAHGPYEVNHVTWCRRYDAAATRRGHDEMLVTTGDDGLVRPWEVKLGPPRAS